MIAEIEQNAVASTMRQLMVHLEAADADIQWLHARTLYVGAAQFRLDRALKELAQAAFCVGLILNKKGEGL